jgi:protein-disulfide isomerase
MPHRRITARISAARHPEEFPMRQPRLVALIAVLILAIAAASAGLRQDQSAPAKVALTYDPARVRGDSSAPVTIVEFSDFQSSQCATVQATLNSLLAKYSGRVKLAFRDFPKPSMHPQAQVAALASRCAGQQGKFWEYHDALLADQANLGEGALIDRARTMKLDVGGFAVCLAQSKDLNDRIEQDRQDAIKIGVTVAPTFFINGSRVVGAQPQAAFEQLIETELNSALAHFPQAFPEPPRQENQIAGGTQLADIVQRANTAAQKGNYTEALPLYQEALRVASPAYMAENEAALHRAIGVCYYRLGRFKEALPEVTRANAMRETAENCALLGDLYNNLSDVPMAERNFQRATEIEPGNAEYCALLAEASCHLGHFDIAQRAIDLGNANARSDETRRHLQRFHLLALMGTGRYAEASRRYSQYKVFGTDFKSNAEPRIAFVALGSPARLAGLESGDLILSFNGEPIPDVPALTAAVDRAEFGATVPVRINRNGTILERKVIVGILPNLPELSAAANRPQISRPTAVPAVTINRIAITPTAVPTGGQFTIEVFYKAASKGAVEITFSIHAAGNKLFESPPKAFEVNGGEPQVFASKINAGNQPGEYTIRVRVSCGGNKAEGETTLTVNGTKKASPNR